MKSGSSNLATSINDLRSYQEGLDNRALFRLVPDVVVPFELCLNVWIVVHGGVEG